MKYLGSKSKIAKHILPIILEGKENYDAYIEPFCGALAVIGNVTGIKKIAYDINPYLIALWKGLKYDLDKPLDISREMYNEYRNLFNFYKIEQITFTENNEPVKVHSIVNTMNTKYLLSNNPDDKPIVDMFNKVFMIGWVGFMGSYNGRFYDGGYSGQAAGRNYIAEQIANTITSIDNSQDVFGYKTKLDDITFRCAPFSRFMNIMRAKAYSCEYLETKQPRYIIYCDPPYKDTKGYGDFSKYFNYDFFYSSMRELHTMGHKVFISEYQMPLDFKCVWEMEVTNSMHPTKTYKPIEKLFTLE